MKKVSQMDQAVRAQAFQTAERSWPCGPARTGHSRLTDEGEGEGEGESEGEPYNP